MAGLVQHLGPVRGSAVEFGLNLGEDHVPDPRYEHQLGRSHQREVLEKGGKVAACSEIRGSAEAERGVEQAAAHHMAHRHEIQADRGMRAGITPASPCRSTPRLGDHALGVHRAFRSAGATGCVNQEAQSVGVVGGNRLHSRQFRPLRDDFAEYVDACRRLSLRQACSCSGHCVAVVVDLRPVVEHDQPGRLRSRQNQLDRFGEVIDARGERRRLGLGDDRPQRFQGCAGLQRHRDGAQFDQRDVDAGVVDAGEPEHRNAVTPTDRIVGQRVGDGAYPCGEFAVGDGLEAGEQSSGRATGVGVGGELDGARTERGTVGIPVEDGADQRGQSQVGPLDGGGDSVVGDGGGELRVRSVQIGDAAFESLVASINRHRNSSRIADWVTRRCV